MLNVLFLKTPFEASLVERHMEINDTHQARTILKQWMNEDDWLSQEQSIQDERGNYITPLVIVCPDGETVDIFGQLITKEPPGPWPFNP